MKKTIALLLAAMLMLAFMAGCTGDETPSDTSASPTPATVSDGAGNESDPSATPEETDMNYPIVTDGSVTFNAWLVIDPNAAAFTQDLADGKNYAWKNIMEKTGINISFLHPSAASSTEQFQVMIAGGDYPDIIYGSVSNYTGGADKAVEDSVFLRLNELAEQYAPNYMRYVEMSETNRKNNYTDEGNMVIFSQVYDRVQPSFAGYGVRQDWLDDLGISRPETISEWHDMLVAFRDNKTYNNAPPMELYKTGIAIGGYFAGAYGVSGSGMGGGNFIQINNEVQLSTMTEGFREYLAEMRKWYSEGLIDTDFIVNGSSSLFPNFPRMASNESGAFPLMYTSAGSYFADSGLAEEGAFVTLVKYPTLNKGDELLAAFKGNGEGTLSGAGSGSIITTACEYPEYAVRFTDYMFSEEGSMLTNYGIEGVTYSVEGGKPMHTDLIANNPDGMTTTTAQHVYLINNHFVFMLDREEDTQNEAALEYREIWSATGKYNIVGNLSYSAEEGTERSAILNDMSTLTEEFTVKVIMGQTELNDETWSNYLNQLKNMNADRAIEITQAAYDRYQSR